MSLLELKWWKVNALKGWAKDKAKDIPVIVFFLLTFWIKNSNEISFSLDRSNNDSLEAVKRINNSAGATTLLNTHWMRAIFARILL